MSFEGSLLVVGLREVLQHLSDERGTGILTLQNEREILAVTFLRGEVVGADSLAEGEETLGALLAQERLVSPQEFAAVVAAQRTGGGRISDLLLERGSIGRAGLLGALRRHTLRLVLAVLEWTDGSYKFYGGEEVSFEDGFDPIAVDEILASAPAGAGIRGDSAFARSASGPRPPEPAPGGALRGLESLTNLAASGRPAAAGRRGIFVPPDPDSVAARPAAPAEVGRPAAIRRRARPWDALRPLLPTLIAFLVFVVWFGARPVDLVASLPWSALGRDEFSASRRLAAFEQVDAAARAYFFVEGRYPDDLAALVDRGLLGQSASRDPWGQPLRFTSDGLIYALETAAEDLGPGAMGAVESIAGDLFLDSSLFEVEAERNSSPLVLLD